MIITAQHHGEPVIAYDFQTMTERELMQVEWRRGFLGSSVESECARLAVLADEELTRRGCYERYT